MHFQKKYDHVSLYDWIRLATKYKCDRNVESELDEQDNNEIDNDNIDDKKTNTDTKASLRKSQRKKYVAQTMKDHIEYENRVDDAYLRGNSWAESTDDDSSFENQDDNNDYFFMEGHRQQYSHAVRLEEDMDDIVPNFVGGSLPRCDRGDREFYCCTMLTMFKPWRTGKDLKLTTETWDDSFLKYKFSMRQCEIIK